MSQAMAIEFEMAISRSREKGIRKKGNVQQKEKKNKRRKEEKKEKRKKKLGAGREGRQERGWVREGAKRKNEKRRDAFPCLGRPRRRLRRHVRGC